MAKSPAPAKQSVLLDYQSPWNVIALIKAFKAGHWPVVFAVSSSLSLKLIIVFSSGLLSSQSTRIQMSSAFATPYHFDATAFTSNLSTSLSTSLFAKWVGPTPYRYFIGTTLLNLSYPLGTTPSLAFQPFNATGALDSNWTGKYQTWAVRTLD